MKPTRITVEDVRASINYKVRMNFTVRWVGRPLANLLTPAFYNSGWSADGVTYFRAMFGALGIILLIVPDYWAAIAAPACFYFCFVLDCVDGNLARLNNSTSYWGKFIDGLVDFLFVLGAPFAVGIGLAYAGENVLWLAIGAAISISSLTSQMVRNRLSFMREWMVNQSGPLDESKVQSLTWVKSVQTAVAGLYVNGTFAAPLLLLVPESGRMMYLLALVPIQLLSELVWAFTTIREARAILDRSRTSIHAAVKKAK